MIQIGAIRPVILPVGQGDQRLSGRQKVVALSEHARRALVASMTCTGLILTDLAKDEDGVPMPTDGLYWSLTHKIDYVGAVVAPWPVGIDIEKIKPVGQLLFRKTAVEKEWALLDDTPNRCFFRYWTAKEAVLKAAGTGVKDLLKCRIVSILDDTHLTVHYQGRDWYVEHIFFNGHIASITRNACQVEWLQA